jgi:lipoprotein
MKKIISVLLVIILSLSISACKRNNYLVNASQAAEKEPFEEIEVEYSDVGCFARFDSVQALEQASDLIVVASPKNTFTDETPTLLDSNNNPVDSYDKSILFYSYTVRDFDVKKVIKGDDKNLKEVKVCETSVLIDNGQKIKSYGDQTVSKQGADYLLFLGLANYSDDEYFAIPYSGKVNVDGKDPANNQIIDGFTLYEIENAYPDLFNYIAEPFESLDITYTNSSKARLNTLDELKESADLIVIASTDTTLTDASPVILDASGQKISITNIKSLADMQKSYTPRDFKVHKVIKGDKNIKNVTVAESVIWPYNSGFLALSGEYIAKADTKYLMFLKADENNPDLYYTYLTQGKFNVDGKDSKRTLPVDKKMLNQIEKEYKAEFEY